MTDRDFYRLDFEHISKDVGRHAALRVAACLEGAECTAHLLPELPFAYDALEPHIDTETVQLHYEKHHKSYVDKLNQTLAPYPQLQRLPLESLLRGLSELPPDIQWEVRNFGGGHFNHSMLWQVLTPKRHAKPSDRLTQELNLRFGESALLKRILTRKSLSLFGSGYTWLYVDPTGVLKVEALPNQDCPLSTGGTPLFLIDLWEHAYYLRYHHERERYLEALWGLINWEEVSERWEHWQTRIAPS